MEDEADTIRRSGRRSRNVASVPEQSLRGPSRPGCRHSQTFFTKREQAIGIPPRHHFGPFGTNVCRSRREPGTEISEIDSISGIKLGR